MKIFLDDQGNDVRKSWVPDGYTVITNPGEFKQTIKQALQDGTPIEAIDFDNDLGEAIEGRHLVKWLQEEHPEIIFRNPTIELRVHSMNNVGHKALLDEIQTLKEHFKELMEAKERPQPFEEFKLQ